MRSFMSIMGGVFILIAIYLLVSEGTKTVAIINALAKPSIEAVKVLQGRG